MREERWVAISLTVIVTVLLCTASCSRQAVEPRPISNIGPEVQESVGGSSEETEQVGQPEEDELWAEVASREAAGEAFVEEKVYFAFDSSALSDQAQEILNSKAQYLRMNPNITITVEGHCDERGTEAYNNALGEQRAESVKVFLVNLGIGADRLKTASYGEYRPVDRAHDETSWARNRRAQFVIN